MNALSYQALTDVYEYLLDLRAEIRAEIEASRLEKESHDRCDTIATFPEDQSSQADEPIPLSNQSSKKAR